MEQSGAHELAQVRMMTETVPLLPGIQHVRQLETPCAEHADSGPHSVWKSKQKPPYHMHRTTRATCLSELDSQAFWFMHRLI